MSKFESVTPMPLRAQQPPLVPTWLDWSATCMCCILPLCVLSAYNAGAMRCDRGISVITWSVVTATALLLAWWLGRCKDPRRAR